MANIWKEGANVNEHPNRNNFDLSYQNHLTMKMGTLYPIMCKEVVPGDSFSIDTAFGLKFMPLVFPVQSKMTAYVHYFYVRNKNLWSNWENWINGLQDCVHPFIEKPSSWFKTGSLADYLDIPTTDISYSVGMRPVSREGLPSGLFYVEGNVVTSPDGEVVSFDQVNNNGYILHNDIYGYPDFSHGSPNYTRRHVFDYGMFMQDQTLYFAVDWPFSLNTLEDFLFFVPDGSLVYRNLTNPSPDSEIFSINDKIADGTLKPLLYAAPAGECRLSNLTPSNFVGRINIAQPAASPFLIASLSPAGSGNPIPAGSFDEYFHGRFGSFSDYDFFLVFQHTMSSTGQDRFPSSQNVEKDALQLRSCVFPPVVFVQTYDTNGNFDASVTPFGSDCNELHRIRLNALPFRAYESIYQAYYRNTQNQQFYVDGEPQFNRYNTTLDDGADYTDYHLEQRNYEQDFLTSAMPSPQQGVAPLVGMTALGDVTIEDENGITTASAEIDDDGTITKVTLTSPAASVEHARTAMNIASAGMSINDFRNVNALQRWLETNLRKGFRYVDFIQGHFGKAPHYDVLDMPEFIGGTSQQVSVSQVTNMADTEAISGDAGKLGMFVGSANCFGGTRNTVRQYCDDFGFIVGIMCVVPTPSYSQMLPKMFLKSDKLDYYFPEFSQLGMQPITYKEVTPIQSYKECIASSGEKHMTDTFGYQRPNYDLVGYTDQVHGQFRTTLKDYLISRLFALRPELGNQFLRISPVDTNHIFSYTAPDADNIMGQVIIKISAKRPVPRICIPSLGR